MINERNKAINNVIMGRLLCEVGQFLIDRNKLYEGTQGDKELLVLIEKACHRINVAVLEAVRAKSISLDEAIEITDKVIPFGWENEAE